MQSNINIYYESLVSDLASRAHSISQDYPEKEPCECVSDAIDDGFIYGTDQAYVIAAAFVNGYFRWGEDPKWEDLDIMLFADVCKELLNILEDERNAKQ